MDVVGSTTGKIIRFLVTHARCSECSARYRTEDVHVLAQSGLRVWDLAAVCPQCYTLSVVRAVVRPNRQPTGPDDAAAPSAPVARSDDAGAWSELTAAESARFRDRPALGADDVLDVCEFLAGFDGDFLGYFCREPDRV